MANVCIVRHLNDLAQGWRDLANKNGLEWSGSLNLIPWTRAIKEKVPHEGRTISINGQSTHMRLCKHCGDVFMEGAE